jgi:hypothetical protein
MYIKHRQRQEGGYSYYLFGTVSISSKEYRIWLKKNHGGCIIFYWNLIECYFILAWMY